MLTIRNILPTILLFKHMLVPWLTTLPTGPFIFIVGVYPVDLYDTTKKSIVHAV